MARLGVVSPPMNSETPMAPSLPTTAISAEAPSCMHVQQRDDGIRREVDVAQRGAGFVQHHAERHGHELEMRKQPVMFDLGKRAQDVVFARIGRLASLVRSLGVVRRLCTATHRQRHCWAQAPRRAEF